MGDDLSPFSEPDSVLTRLERLIGTRCERPEIARGESTVLDAGVQEIVALRPDLERQNRRHPEQSG